MKRFLITLTLLALALAVVFAGGSKESTSSNKLRVGMECGYAPYNWAQSENTPGSVKISGSPDYAYGYDVMMASKIANALGKELEIVKLDWDSIPLAVQSGSIDCGICGQSITSQRLMTLDFTTPYYYASIVGLVLADGPYANAQGVSDLAGARCTSQINTIWYDVCLPQIPNANILTAQETAPAMLVALNSGACQLIVTDMPTAMAACVAYPNMKMLDFSESSDNFKVSEEEINIGISVQKGNNELTNAINSVLATMSVEDFNKMMDEAIASQPLSN